jgi:hypothetical protein
MRVLNRSSWLVGIVLLSRFTVVTGTQPVTPGPANPTNVAGLKKLQERVQQAAAKVLPCVVAVQQASPGSARTSKPTCQ